MKENTIAELQKIESNKKSTIPQETSDSPKDKTNKESHEKEHNKAVEPEQKVSYGQRSDWQEVPSQAKSYPQAAAVNSRINQEMSVKPAICAGVKPHLEERRNDNADIEQIPINDSPGSESTEKQTELGMMTRMVYLV